MYKIISSANKVNITSSFLILKTFIYLLLIDCSSQVIQEYVHQTSDLETLFCFGPWSKSFQPFTKYASFGFVLYGLYYIEHIYYIICSFYCQFVEGFYHEIMYFEMIYDFYL